MNLRPWGYGLIVGLCGVLMVSCGKSDAARSPAKGERTARPVRVGRAEMRPMARAIPVTGTLAAQEQSVLSAKVAGRLQQITVDVGSVVHQGDLLAQVEPRDYELRLQQATAALAQARTTLGLPLEGDDDRADIDAISTVKQAKAVFEESTKTRNRLQNLSRSGIASDSDVDTAEASYRVTLARYETAVEEARSRLAALAQRRAEHEIARKQLADASVRAPFDSAVQARPGSVGEYVAPGTPIVKLVKTDPLRLRLEVPERESVQIRAGQLVRLLVEGDTNVYTGNIARLSPALDEQSRMLLVEADVPSRGSLRPGLFARARIVVNEHEQVVSVPTNAIVTFAGLEKVVLVKKGQALEQVVTTGRRELSWVEIVTGLIGEETVVLDPGNLHTGQAVAVSDSGGSLTKSESAKAPGQ